MKKKPYFYSRSVQGGGKLAVSFIVPLQLEGFILERVIIRENLEMANAGGAIVQVSEVCNQFNIGDKTGIPSHVLQSSSPVGNGTTVQPGVLMGSKSKLKPVLVSGGDGITIEVDMKKVSGAVVDVLIVGQKVGAF